MKLRKLTTMDCLRLLKSICVNIGMYTVTISGTVLQPHLPVFTGVIYKQSIFFYIEVVCTAVDEFYRNGDKDMSRVVNGYPVNWLTGPESVTGYKN